MLKNASSNYCLIKNDSDYLLESDLLGCGFLNVQIKATLESKFP
jgi:hypothetical protein